VAKLVFELQGSPCGDGEAPPVPTGWRHYLYLCPKCGDVWARVCNSSAIWEEWHARHVLCPKHPHGVRPAGSLYVPGDHELLQALPPVLLQREFNIALEWAEKELQNDEG